MGLYVTSVPSENGSLNFVSFDSNLDEVEINGTSYTKVPDAECPSVPTCPPQPVCPELDTRQPVISDPKNPVVSCKSPAECFLADVNHAKAYFGNTLNCGNIAEHEIECESVFEDANLQFEVDVPNDPNNPQAGTKKETKTTTPGMLIASALFLIPTSLAHKKGQDMQIATMDDMNMPIQTWTRSATLLYLGTANRTTSVPNAEINYASQMMEVGRTYAEALRGEARYYFEDVEEGRTQKGGRIPATKASFQIQKKADGTLVIAKHSPTQSEPNKYVIATPEEAKEVFDEIESVYNRASADFDSAISTAPAVQRNQGQDFVNPFEGEFDPQLALRSILMVQGITDDKVPSAVEARQVRTGGARRTVVPQPAGPNCDSLQTPEARKACRRSN